MSQRIGVVGSSMTDLIVRTDRVPEAGETLAAMSLTTDRGGKGANQAVAAARLGADVMLVARIGDDAFGAETLRHLAKVGIDLAHMRAVPGESSGVASIWVERSGENRILIVPGANRCLGPADIDAAEPELSACGLILLQLEIPIETVIRTIEIADRHGIDVLLNPAPATAGLDLERIRPVRFLVPNQTELALLTGLPTGTRAEAEAAANHLLAHGLQCVIVTLGAEGALLVEDGRAVHVPALRVTPVDTTGAGDALCGAFAQHYVRHRDVEAALGWAVRYAALAITRPGTQGAFADAASFAAWAETLPGPKPFQGWSEA